MAIKTRVLRPFIPAALATFMLILTGCATGSYGSNDNSYGTTYSSSTDNANGSTRSCSSSSCGVVHSIDQVSVSSDNQSEVLGTIIGAVVGGALGNQVGKGDGRKAATVASAVVGGAVGNRVGKRSSGNMHAWRVVVRLDDGRTATVTQHEDPRVSKGDYVQIMNDKVYMR